MKRLLLSGTDALARLIVPAPLLTWICSCSKKNEAARNLITTPDAAKGNTGLATAIYIGTGVVINLSSPSTHRKHVTGRYLGDAALYFQRKSLV